ncbi:MAG: TonB family protein [Terracidiphilus sp.]
MQYAAHFRKRIARYIALSAACHLLVTTILFVAIRRPAVRVVESEARYYPATLYLPGGTRAKPRPLPPGKKHHIAEKSPALHSDLALNAQPAPAAGRPVSAAHEPLPGNGTDAESADPAFPVFSPRPPVTDRSLLPSSDQQVIVDVKVSASGEVLEATLVKGLGNALDQIVLDTVKTWRFQPATLKGSPVPTEAELIFPFNEKYPTAPS